MLEADRDAGVVPAELAVALGGKLTHGSVSARVRDVTHDSRDAGPGVAFVAIAGAATDGHAHAASAVAAGCTLLIVERHLDLDVDQIVVGDSRTALGDAAAMVHGRPADQLRVVGITGTNGKTTTAWLVEAAFAAAGVGTALFGTIATRIVGAEEAGVRTTPEASDLQRLLRSAHTRGADAAVMEVSSHGLQLRRLQGMRFDVGVFTNLSQDHLDFHPDMEHYFAAKATLFAPSWCGQAVIVVVDDWGRRLADLAVQRGIPTTLIVLDQADAVDGADVLLLSDIVATSTSTSARLRGRTVDVEIHTRLVGAFNVLNAAAAVVAAVGANVAWDVAIAGVAACPGVPGRLERVPSEPGQPVVLVDYAHTPDAVARAVDVLRPLLDEGGRMHVVLGAGGDRDRAKRGPMGAAAAAADRVIVTSDNPRSEDPQSIVDAVLAGAVAAGTGAEIVADLDRHAAIARALHGAGPHDIVLIAGKGHETGQTFADHAIDFDDRLVAASVMASGAVA